MSPDPAPAGTEKSTWNQRIASINAAIDRLFTPLANLLKPKP